MRILCLIESLGSGGAERQIVGLAKMLRETGADVRVLTYYPNDFYRYELEESNVDYLYCSNAKGKLKRIPALRHEVRNYHPDALIAYLPTAEVVACILRMISGIRFKLIVSERNTTQVYDLRERIRFNLFRLADYVVPNSYTQASFIKERCPWLTRKVHVITNFIDTDFFSPADDNQDENDLLRVVCVARITPQKNVLRFLDVVKRLKLQNKSIIVKWYGVKDGVYAEECLMKVKALGIEDMIEFVGATKDVRSVYHRADVFCLPSLYEGFPNVVCEAMSCGLPILCSRVCDNPHIVQEGINGYMFDPVNLDDMYKSFERFMDLSFDERRAMREESRRRSLSLFSKDIFLREYMGLLR